MVWSSRYELVLFSLQFHQLRPHTVQLSVNVPVAYLFVMVLLLVLEAELLAGCDASQQDALIALDPKGT